MDYKYFLLSEFAFPPVRGSIDSAGYDLKSAYNYVVPARGKELIKTDLTFEFPNNCYGRIAPRSGLALKHSIHVGAGVIDRDYTGNVGVMLFNHSDVDFCINRGDRIAQIICTMYNSSEIKPGNKITITERGDKGFGSSGV